MPSKNEFAFSMIDSIGAIENTGGSVVVLPRADNRVGIVPIVDSLYNNGGWVEKDKTLLEVAVIFHSLGYDGIKIIQVNDPNPSHANTVINDFPTRGYHVVNNNCLSATIDVLDAYGVKNLPFQIAHVAPNDYYAKVRGEEYLWYSTKKKYTDTSTGVSLTNMPDPSSTTQGDNVVNGYQSRLDSLDPIEEEIINMYDAASSYEPPARIVNEQNSGSSKPEN